MLLVTTAFGENVPKYGTWHKSCSLKYTIKFKHKCWRKKTASFVQFTLSWHLCALLKLVGEFNTVSLKEVYEISGWKPTNTTSVFTLQTSVYRCLMVLR
jgi:hypothetical protein